MEDVEGATATSSNSDPRPTCKFWAKGSCKFPAESCKAGKHSNCSTTDAPSGSMTNKAQKTNNNLNELLTGLKKVATWSKDLLEYHPEHIAQACIRWDDGDERDGWKR
jgi:hypothetical protein